MSEEERSRDLSIKPNDIMRSGRVDYIAFYSRNDEIPLPLRGTLVIRYTNTAGTGKTFQSTCKKYTHIHLFWIPLHLVRNRRDSELLT